MSISALSGSLSAIDTTWYMSRMSRSQNTQSMKSMPQVDTAEFASTMLDRLDANGDGSLSIEETDLSEDMFANFDADGDGLHSLEELESALSEAPAGPPPGAQGPSGPPPGGPPPGGPPPGGGSMDSSEVASDLISSLDTDGDGVLSAEETGLSANLFAEIDADGDGLLAQEEVETFLSVNQAEGANAMPPPPPPGGAMDAAQAANDILSSRDVDGDGVLSIEETDLPEEVFGELDTDGDGFHSTEEIQSAVEQKAADDHSAFFDALNQLRGQAAYQETSMMSSLFGSSDWLGSNVLSGLSLSA